MKKHSLTQAAKALGARGGSRTSPAKVRAARKNGRRGGRAGKGGQ